MKNQWLRLLLPAVLALALPAFSGAQISIDVSVNTPPPELPVYEQPPIPEDGFIWTPGFWAWSDDDQDYYWVPGTWVPPPQPDYLWTPGYWGFVGGAYLFHSGYWGPHVGFYGGVNYGYGYGGSGYEGGYWQGGHLFYNRSVTNISNVNITNVYNKTVINNVTVNRVSFNGGEGGVRAAPTAAEEAASRERHIEATPQQRTQVQTARNTPSLRASQNQGHPPIAATARPGAFSGAGVVAAKRGGTLSVVPAHPQPAARPVAGAPARNEGEIRGNENVQRPAPARVAPPVQHVNPQPERVNPPQQHVNPPQQERVNPPPQQHVNPPPQPRAAPPRPAEHPPEREEERERH